MTDQLPARAETSASDGERPGGLRALWTDRLGRVSIRSLQIILVIVLASALIWGLVQVKLVVIPIMIAVIIASAMAPVIGWLRRRGVPAMLATWITLIASIVVFGGIVTLIVFAVRSQWDELVTSTAEGIEELQNWVTGLPLPIDAIDWDAVSETVVGFLTSAQFGSGALAGVSAAAEVVTGAVLVVVLLFFFLKDGDKIWRFFLTPLTPRHKERGWKIGQTSVRVLGGYVRGTAIVALVDAVAIGIVLAVLGVPLAIPLAVLVFFGAFIPLVGATVTGILAALVALVTNGPVVALIVVIAVIAVNQLEGDLLQPVVMAQSLKLHPLVILVALTVGTILGGIVGAVLSVPIAAVGWAVIKLLTGTESVDTTPEKPRRLFGRRRGKREPEGDAAGSPSGDAPATASGPF